MMLEREMLMSKVRVGPVLIVMGLLGGIAAAIVLLWVPGLQRGYSAIPEPQLPFWRMADEEDLAIDTSSVRLAVHDVIVSPRHVTVVYSIELTGGESEGEEATVNLKTALAGSNGDLHRAVAAHELGFSGGTTLGAIVFEPYRLKNSGLSLVIPELSLGSPDASESLYMDDPIEMHILTRLRPHETTEHIGRLPGVRTGAVGEAYGSFLGSSPQGQVATVAYHFGGEKRYFLAKRNGSFEELTEEQMDGILEYLGIRDSIE